MTTVGFLPMKKPNTGRPLYLLIWDRMLKNKLPEKNGMLPTNGSLGGPGGKPFGLALPVTTVHKMSPNRAVDNMIKIILIFFL